MVVFADSFDNYDTLAEYWQQAGNAGINTSGSARTGIGCCQIGNFDGPRQPLPHLSTMLVATNWNCNQLGSVMGFENTDADVGQNSEVLVVFVIGDGNVQIRRGPAGSGAVIAQTNIPGLVQFNTYVSIALKSHCSATLGTLELWINGVKRIDLTGLNTLFPGRPDIPYFNRIQLMAPGGLPTCFHDDVYVLDCDTPPHTDFLGALRLYALPPTANAGVAWTPLSGTNWSEVNEVPPDGDTSYNSSDILGAQDQYLYPATGVPSNASVPFVAHLMDLRTDVGSRGVSSVVQGEVNGVVIAPTSGYHIYGSFYDEDPQSNAEWLLSSFPITAGPKVTL